MEPFSSPRRICPRKPERLRNLGNLGKTLGEPWWNLLAAQDGSAPENQRDYETWATLVKLWWNLLAAQDGSAPENQRVHETWATLVKLWWNPGRTLEEPLMEPSAEPFSSPRRICPREPQRVRKQFCPETFTMAEDPKAVAVGEKR